MGWFARHFGLGACLAALAASAAASQAPAFEIVTGDDSEVTRQISDDLARRLRATLGPASTGHKTIYVAIGPEALRTVSARALDGVVISAFTSSRVWHAVTGALAPARASSYTAVYAEPSPYDQLRLIGLLYKAPVSIAAILSQDTAYLRPILREAGGAAVGVENFAAGDDLNKVLNRLAKTKVLLAMPDRSVYNTENIRNILLSTYRHNQGVIGFSADMVKAGALASTYSAVEDINAQVAEMAGNYINSGTLPAPQFPHYFQVIVNDGVARSLNVTVDEAVRKFARRPPARLP